MKILLTGSNSRQCGTAKVTSKRIFDAWNLCQMMKTFADVDFMPVSKETDFSKYDIVVSGFGGLGSFTSTDVLKALYAIGKAAKPVVLLEDWRCPKAIATGLKSTYAKGYASFLEKDFNKSLSDGSKFYNGVEDGSIEPEVVWQGIEKIIAHPEDIKFLIPAFSWGDKGIVAKIVGTKPENILYFDQTPYVMEQQNMQDVPYDSSRMKKFVYCGLTNQDSWLKKRGIKDCTDCFGHKPYEKLPDEAAVNHKHSEYLGVVVPEYYHSGSGWFRVRYIYGAMAKNVFMISENDAGALGVPILKGFNNYSDSEIEAAAMETYEAVKKYIPTKEQTCKNLEEQFTNA